MENTSRTPMKQSRLLLLSVDVQLELFIIQLNDIKLATWILNSKTDSIEEDVGFSHLMKESCSVSLNY